MEDYKGFLMGVIDDYNLQNEEKVVFRQEGHTTNGTDKFLLRLEVPGGVVFKADYIGINGTTDAMQEAYKRMLQHLLGYVFDAQFKVQITHNR